MRIWRARRRSSRAFWIAGACSALFHLLLALAVLFGGLLSPSREAKKGEPIFVDMAPDKPEDKAPRGNPSRPVGPDAPEPPKPPAPKAAEPKVRMEEFDCLRARMVKIFKRPGSNNEAGHQGVLGSGCAGEP